MSIRSYCKIWNLGHRAVETLLNDEVIVQEKIDGSQFSFSVVNGELFCRSKGSEINPEEPEKMFQEAVDTAKSLIPILNEKWVYRCEYLKKPKHNTLAYDRIPNNHLILFDVDAGLECYLPYLDVCAEAKRLNLEVVPLVYEGKVESYDKFKSFLNRVSILGGQKIEGVVIKNYNQFGPDGKTLMAKYVSEEFKESHYSDWKTRNPVQNDIILNLISDYRREPRWNKAIQHLKESGDLTDSPKDIGMILKEVSKDTHDECADEIKEKLFKWAWPKISRGIIKGLPEWYKDKLAQKQFEVEDA